MLVARALLPPRYGSLPGALWRRPRGVPDSHPGSGVSRVPTLRDPFLPALAKAALLPRIISALDDLPQPPPPGAPRVQPSRSRASRSVSQVGAGPAEVGVAPDSVHAFWHAFARSFPLCSFWSARYAPAGSQRLKYSRMRTTSLRRAVPLRLAQQAVCPGTSGTSGVIQ